ncbi:unnamed protein product, partial [Mesorhabditis belari]|uniref:Major facilitator superfamily (MFS) profile domain-containing protein n=1 Tax=Mesorhabditis belari TaxID=2138241 RepID=A0AAF3EC29_9BILA
MCTARYYITILTAILGGSAQFYSYGIVNPCQELITQWINLTYMERSGTFVSETNLNLIWALVVGSVSLGALAGALLVRVLSERCGRRNALIINGIFNIIGAFCELIARSASSPELLIIGRFILGANMGLTSGVVPMYLMELTPAKYRGAAGTLHMVAVSFSDWFSLLIGLPEVLGGSNWWPIAFALPGIPALALCFILPFCPESPKYLLMTRGNREAAYDSIVALVGEKQAKPVFNELIRESARDKSRSGSFWELFTSKKLRLPLLVSLLVMVAQQFTGCTAVFAYSTDMFINAKLDPQTARYATLAIGVVYFLFACSAPLLIDRVGRRPLSLFQLIACLIALSLLTLFTGIQQYGQATWASYGTIGALVLYMCVYGVGSPIPWMITGELFNQHFRSTAVTVSVFVAYLMATIISSAYLPFQQMVGVTFSYMPFIVVSSISIVVLYFILPETKNRDVNDIVNEARARNHSLSVGMPWNAVSQEGRTEMKKLLDDISEGYSSISN